MNRAILAAMVGAVLAIGAFAKEAYAYPDRPITFVVAWAAGGATDLIARAVTPRAAEILGVNIVVRNIAGAAGTIGTAEVARAGPDGYTVMQSPAGPVSLQVHLRDLPYGRDSFEPVCRLTLAPLAIMVRQDSPYRTVEDLVEAARAAPGDILYGSAGAGTLPHISMIALGKAAGVEFTHVPYSGSAAAIRALLGGEVHVVSEQSNLVPRYGLHPVAIWAKQPTPEFPNTPTVNKSGYDLNFANWNAWYVPAGTPREIIDVLAAACEQALQDPSVIQRVAVGMGTPIAFLGPDEFREFYRKEFELNRDLLTTAGLVN
jgi:tripartite-type tricarboxylate transporter receptor subunit TctC